MFFENEQRDQLNKDFVKSAEGIAFAEQIEKAEILKKGGPEAELIDTISLMITPGSFVGYDKVMYDNKAYKAVVDFNLLIWFIFEE